MSLGVRSKPDLRGTIPRSFEHIYKHIGRTVDQQYLVRASYLEIYQEEIRDLLSKDQTKRLELKERPDTGEGGMNCEIFFAHLARFVFMLRFSHNHTSKYEGFLLLASVSHLLDKQSMYNVVHCTTDATDE